MRGNQPILLVEDNEVDVLAVRRAFERTGIDNPLVPVGNGREALDYLRKLPATRDCDGEQVPCLVLLDINMPIMNGIEFLTELKSDDNLKRLPVVVLTSSDEPHDRRAAFNLSAAGYVVKSPEFGRFVDAMRTIDQYWTLSESPN